LPARILVTAGDRVGKNRQGNRAEAGEAGQGLFLLRSGRTLLLLDPPNRAYRGDEVAGLGFFAARDGWDRRWRVEVGIFDSSACLECQLTRICLAGRRWRGSGRLRRWLRCWCFSGGRISDKSIEQRRLAPGGFQPRDV
jgi:hypothetical protein